MLFRSVALADRAGVRRPVSLVSPQPSGSDFIHVRVGGASVEGGAIRPLAFVMAPDPSATVTLQFLPETFTGPVTDLLTGNEVAVTETPRGQQVVLGPTDWGISVLAGGL